MAHSDSKYRKKLHIQKAKMLVLKNRESTDRGALKFGFV